MKSIASSQFLCDLLNLQLNKQLSCEHHSPEFDGGRVIHCNNQINLKRYSILLRHARASYFGIE